MNRAVRRLIRFSSSRDRTSSRVKEWIMLRKVLLGCGIVSSVLYVATDILASLRYAGYSFADQQVSELLAAGSPVRTLMIGLNVIPYAVLMTAFGVGVWTVAGPKRAGRIAGALLIGYAVVGLAGGLLFRMNTREVLAAGEGDWRGGLHVPVTMVMSLSLLVGMGFAATLLGRGFRWYTVGTILTLLAFGGLVGTQAGAIEANEPTPWMGTAERVNIYATMLWMAVLATGLLRSERPVTPQPLGRPAVAPPMLPR
jgi:hypothetical protein